MPYPPPNLDPSAPALEAFLLGQVDFDRVLALQQRLVDQSHERGDGQVTLLLCEHRPIITLGRGGSPGDVAMQSSPVRTGQIEVRWVNRGGGALVHCPGQLAIYPIVPLRWHALTIGQYLGRLQTAIVETLDELNVPIKPRPSVVPDRPRDCPNLRANENGTVPFAGTTTDLPGHSRYGIYGRTGQLAMVGVAVRHWVSYYGAYLNVSPPTGLLQLVQPEKGTAPICAKQPEGRSGKSGLSPFPPAMSSLVAERCGPVKMTSIRAVLVRRLADHFNCNRYHLYTGHPLLRTTA